MFMFRHLLPFVRYRMVWSTGLVFVLIGFIFGSWTALIPGIKQRFLLDEAQLGLLLLALPSGVILMNPISVPLIRWLGSSGLSRHGLALTAAAFILPTLMPDLATVAAALFIAGMAFSATNIAMNTCAANIEQAQGFSIIATCHGLWSIGAMLGAITVSSLIGLGMGATTVMIMLFLLIWAGSVALRWPMAGLPPDSEQEPKSKKRGIVMPNQALWLLITISICVYLMEGAMADWSAVYMREVLQRPESEVGLGFAIYAFFMASGRLLGDQLIARFSSKRVLQYGGLIAAVGLLILILQPSIAWILLGFALAGVGVSLGAPIVYAASAKVPGLPAGAGLATMNTFAMGAFLGGPALIGFTAKWQSLPFAFGIVAVGALLWALQARWMQ